MSKLSFYCVKSQPIPLTSAIRYMLSSPSFQLGLGSGRTTLKCNLSINNILSLKFLLKQMYLFQNLNLP